MSSFGTVPLQTIWAMLKDCAEGHVRFETDHHWRIDFGGRTYPSLPKGQHGTRRPEIEIGHVKAMVNHLMIAAACANRHIPQLRIKSSDTVLPDVRVLRDSALAVSCEMQGRPFTVHPHLIRPASEVRRRGDQGKLVIPESLARELRLV